MKPYSPHKVGGGSILVLGDVSLEPWSLMVPRCSALWWFPCDGGKSSRRWCHGDPGYGCGLIWQRPFLFSFQRMILKHGTIITFLSLICVVVLFVVLVLFFFLLCFICKLVSPACMYDNLLAYFSIIAWCSRPLCCVGVVFFSCASFVSWYPSMYVRLLLAGWGIFKFIVGLFDPFICNVF
jgi:hypothetical protein